MRYSYFLLFALLLPVLPTPTLGHHIMTVSVPVASGQLRGTVRLPNGQPADYVSVALQGTSRGTATDEQGRFQLRHVAPGSYTIVVSFVGYVTQQLAVEVSPEGITQVPLITLVKGDKELGEVTVTGQRNSFASKQTDYVARMPLRNLENPQVYTVAGKELLKQKDVVDYASAVASLPGASGASVSPYGFTAVYMRGFLVQSYVRNGLYAQALSGGDPQIIERLEAIKGPSGTLFGSAGASATGQGNYGGIINKVTKRPFDGQLLEAGLSGGSYSLTRAVADVNLPLNDDHTVLFRLNAAYNSQGSFQDVGGAQSFLLAPTQRFNANDRLTVNLDAEINSLTQPSPFYFQGASHVSASSRDQLHLDYFKSYSSNDLTHPATLQNFYFGQVNYQLAPQWQLSGSASLTDANSLAGVVLGNVIGDNKLVRTVYDWDYEWHTADLQANLNGRFDLGSLQNKILVGVDYQRFQQLPVSGGLTYNVDTVNLAKPNVPVLNVNKIRSNYGYIFSQRISSNDYAAYASDVLNLTDRLNLMLSLRYDHYVFGGREDLYAGITTAPGYGKNAVTPKLGATYQILENKFSLFGNYMQGFSYVAPNAQGQTFQPEFARQTEGGLKLDLNDRISATASYYFINVQDKVRTDPANALLQVQDGIQRSQGVDLDVSAKLADGFSLIGGYSYNKSEFSRSNKNIEGNRPAGVPNNAANAWLSYTLPVAALRGLGAGFGITYNGQVYFNDTNTLAIPSYTLLKASLFYSLPWFRASVTVDNLTDQRYYNYAALPQLPRRALASLSFKF